MKYKLYVWRSQTDSYRHESFVHPDAHTDKFQIRGEVEEREKTDLYVDFRSPYVYFHPEGAECVGERHLDSRCTSSYQHYVPVALAEEGRKRFENARNGQNKRADAYYSQPWV